MARCNVGVPLIKFLVSVTSAQTPHSNPLALSASEPVAALSIGNHQRCDPVQVQWFTGFFLRRPPSPFSLPASAKVILASLCPGGAHGNSRRVRWRGERITYFLSFAGHFGLCWVLGF
jgi:hypothetical protein